MPVRVVIPGGIVARSNANAHQPRTALSPGAAQPKGVNTMIVLWILLAVLYVACWIYFGLSTFRKGHYWMFWIGFFFPVLWIIGALIGPTPRAAGVA
jgi:hypothetical protein